MNKLKYMQREVVSMIAVRAIARINVRYEHQRLRSHMAVAAAGWLWVKCGIGEERRINFNSGFFIFSLLAILTNNRL